MRLMLKGILVLALIALFASSASAEVSLMNESARTKAFTAESVEFAVGGGCCEAAVFEAATAGPRCFGVVKLDALHACPAEPLPHLEAMSPEAGIRVVVPYQGAMVGMVQVKPRDVVVQHPFRMCDCKIV